MSNNLFYLPDVPALLIGSIPPGEGAQACAEGCGGAEAEVGLEWGGVGVGYGDIAGLHRD